MGNKKILISGYYGFNNSGDDAILKAVVTGLRDRDSNIVITVLSNSPLNTEEIYGVKSIYRLNLFKILNRMASTDIFISGGGSLLQDITSTRSIFYYLATMFIAILLGKPFMIYANGIGPINKKANRRLTKYTLNKASLITLRDQNSKKTLEEIGIDKKMHVTADPVFSLKASSLNRVLDIFKKEKVPTDKKLIGISLREWDKSEEFSQIISKAIDSLVEKYDVNVLLIPMHYPDDLKISQEVCKKTNTKKCFVLEEEYSVEDTMGIIDQLNLIIGMRLHSLIYAATQAVPMIGLSYDPKVSAFIKSLEQKTDLDISRLEYDELINMIDSVLENSENIRKNLLVKKELFKSLAEKNIDLLFEIL